ncbi:hypothetical protein EVAR_31013_1 [Eumeta japonica]|uniref:Uncharacterized protein n=1 Tax=Eumeta variegata TaxID=151549 RepID=A0A4C1VH08_EUMVA|nr:hypothetical protein EVAR_31013_1 [Eumeta japonica]
MNSRSNDLNKCEPRLAFVNANVPLTSELLKKIAEILSIKEITVLYLHLEVTPLTLPSPRNQRRVHREGARSPRPAPSG